MLEGESQRFNTPVSHPLINGKEANVVPSSTQLEPVGHGMHLTVPFADW